MANSELKTALEEEGGRYMVSKIKEKGLVDMELVNRTHKDSKEEYVGIVNLEAVKEE